MHTKVRNLFYISLYFLILFEMIFETLQNIQHLHYSLVQHNISYILIFDTILFIFI